VSGYLSWLCLNGSVMTVQAGLRKFARCCTACLVSSFYTGYQDQAPVDLLREYSAFTVSFDFVVFDSADSVSAWGVFPTVGRDVSDEFVFAHSTPHIFRHGVFSVTVRDVKCPKSKNEAPQAAQLLYDSIVCYLTLQQQEGWHFCLQHIPFFPISPIWARVVS
jgi:hypothetical protein